MEIARARCLSQWKHTMCRMPRRRGGRPSCPSGRRARWPARRPGGGHDGEGEGRTRRRGRRDCRGGGWYEDCAGEASAGAPARGGGGGGAAARVRSGWRGADSEWRVAPCRAVACVPPVRQIHSTTLVLFRRAPGLGQEVFVALLLPATAGFETYLV
jgi:hypothetical protein